MIRSRRAKPSRPAGIHGDLDAPRNGETYGREDVLVGGWVFAESGSIVDRVDVLADGVLAARIPVELPRDDIARGYPDFGEAASSGFTARVDLTPWERDHVRITARAVRRDGSTFILAEVDCRLRDGSELSSADGNRGAGCWLAGDTITSGFQRIYGVARASGGIARVDVRLDGRELGRARVGLPGTYQRPTSVEDRIGAFEFVFDVPADGGVHRLEAAVTSMDGDAFEAVPLDFESRTSPAEKLIDAKRLTQLMERFPRRTGEPETGTVLVMTHDLGLGGGQLYLQELLLRLHERGHRFAVASLAGGVLVDQLEELGIPVHVTGAFDLNDPESYEGRLADLARWAIPLGCSAALGNTMLVFPGMDMAGRLGIPTVWALHESFDLDQFWMEAYATGLAHSHVKERARLALRDAKRVVFEAEATRQLYEPFLAADSGMVVPYGISLAELDAYAAEHERSSCRRDRGIEDDDFVLLCMGTVEPRKAQLMLVQAFSRLDEGTRAKLVLVGARPGGYLDAVEDFIERAGMADRVRVEPIVRDTYGWYLAADLLVCASDVESLPRSILEAMALGIPVLSTAVFGVPELITNNETGFLCDVRDVASLSNRLKDVLGLHPADLAEIAAAGAELVRSKHDPSIYVDKYVEILSEMAELSTSTTGLPRP